MRGNQANNFHMWSIGDIIHKGRAENAEVTYHNMQEHSLKSVYEHSAGIFPLSYIYIGFMYLCILTSGLCLQSLFSKEKHNGLRMSHTSPFLPYLESGRSL